MKALPKRKGNAAECDCARLGVASMKALPKRKGNMSAEIQQSDQDYASMKALPKRKGNDVCAMAVDGCCLGAASMKALPKRKGNLDAFLLKFENQGLNESPSEKEGKLSSSRSCSLMSEGLNESPSEKEGKSRSTSSARAARVFASMKALPKRKGNSPSCTTSPQPSRLNESPSEKEGK